MTPYQSMPIDPQVVRIHCLLFKIVLGSLVMLRELISKRIGQHMHAHTGSMVHICQMQLHATRWLEGFDMIRCMITIKSTDNKLWILSHNCYSDLLDIWGILAARGYLVPHLSLQNT